MKFVEIDNIEIPPGLIENVDSQLFGTDELQIEAIKQILSWLANNPRFPTDNQLTKILSINSEYEFPDILLRIKNIIADWQNQMFVKTEPSYPASILRLANYCGVKPGDKHFDILIEAFNAGRIHKEE